MTTTSPVASPRPRAALVLLPPPHLLGAGTVSTGTQCGIRNRAEDRRPFLVPSLGDMRLRVRERAMGFASPARSVPCARLPLRVPPLRLPVRGGRRAVLREPVHGEQPDGVFLRVRGRWRGVRGAADRVCFHKEPRRLLVVRRHFSHPHKSIGMVRAHVLPKLDISYMSLFSRRSSTRASSM